MIIAQRWRLPHVMHYVGLSLLLLFAWDVIVAVLYVVFGQRWLALTDLPMPLVGSALALFVSLRNNNAYARWWEARTLWGAVVNTTRTFARELRLFMPAHPLRPVLIDLMVAYAHALRCHLRGQTPWDEIARLLPPGVEERLRGASNVPDALLAEIADRLSALKSDGTLDTIALTAFDGSLTALGNAQGGTERIKNTPLPRQYTVFPRVFVQVFCFLLPLAMVTDLGLATPLGSSLVGFIFLALDKVGADLESPFANAVYDVPLTSITRTIEINLRQSAGHHDLPKPVVPVDGVLW
jgi:putative membrane protein